MVNMLSGRQYKWSVFLVVEELQLQFQLQFPFQLQLQFQFQLLLNFK